MSTTTAESAFTNILYEKKENIAYVTLNRPKVLNALSHTTWENLQAAFQDVSSALISREKLAVSRIQAEESVAAYQASVQVSTQRYLAGTATYFEVLEAQLLRFPAENSLAQTQLNQLIAIVQLYRALGGGWNLDNAQFTGGH